MYISDAPGWVPSPLNPNSACSCRARPHLQNLSAFVAARMSSRSLAVSPRTCGTDKRRT